MEEGQQQRRDRSDGSHTRYSEALYGFGSGQSKKTIAENHKKSRRIEER